MSNRSSASVGFILAGPIDIRPITTKLSQKSSHPVQDMSAFGTTEAPFLQLPVTTTEFGGHESWYDDAEYTTAADMVALASGYHVLMIAEQGNTAALKADCTGGLLNVGFETSFEQGNYHKAAVELAVSGALDEAWIVCPLAQVAGDGNTEASYIDMGAAGGGTTGGNAYMSCTQLALTGSTNIIITVEDSANHIAWADHTVFTALTAVGAEKKVATDQTVNRYLAVKRVFTGLAGSPTATFTVAFKVNSPHA